MTESPRWTVDESCALHGRAIAWMLGLTLPVAAVAGMLAAACSAPQTWTFTGGPWWSTLWGVVGWAVVVDAVSVVPVAVGALVTLPLTFALGRLLGRVRSARVQVVATSVLAGVLAAVPVAFGGVGGLVVTVPVSLAAGAAGALARRGQLRSARAQA
ncbi:hypothetical protein [Curtobacterium luteum]|uniref:hypothetical protein n=1 Tax=Curtobacterium luteum TaxID=33881 RepID=UPI0038088F7E